MHQLAASMSLGRSRMRQGSQSLFGAAWTLSRTLPYLRPPNFWPSTPTPLCICLWILACGALCCWWTLSQTPLPPTSELDHAPSALPPRHSKTNSMVKTKKTKSKRKAYEKTRTNYELKDKNSNATEGTISHYFVNRKYQSIPVIIIIMFRA